MRKGAAARFLLWIVLAGLRSGCGRFPFLPNRGVNIGNYVLVDDVAQGQILAMERGRRLE